MGKEFGRLDMNKLYRHIRNIPYGISEYVRLSKLNKIMEHSCYFSSNLDKLLKLPNIDEQLSNPNSVIYKFLEEWHGVFIHVCSGLDIYGKGAEYLFNYQLDSFHIDKEEDKLHSTYKQLLEDMVYDVWYCSDRWSLGRLLRNHWIYQHIMWDIEVNNMKYLHGSIVKDEMYKGYRCIVRRGMLDNPCGYVDVTDDINFNNKDEDFCDSILEVHGGITFYGKLHEIPDRTFVGFDMMHPFDLDENMKSIYNYDQCLKEARNLVDQIVMYRE